MRALPVTLSIVAVATPLIFVGLIDRGTAPAAAHSAAGAVEPPPAVEPSTAPRVNSEMPPPPPDFDLIRKARPGDTTYFRPRLMLVGSPSGEQELGIAKADVAIRIDGPLALTELTLTFRNDTDRVLEGNLEFPLPENAVLSGYALDVNGTLVDGVPVEKNQAREIFETEERRNVDPGLLEQKGSGNNFETRIYPLPAHGARTVRIQYVTDLQTINGGDLRYLAPLRWGEPVPDAHFSVAVTHEPVAPVLNFGGRESVLGVTAVGGGFLRAPSSYTMDKSVQNIRFDNDLTITLPGLGSQAQLAIEPFTKPPLPGPSAANPLVKESAEDYFALADAPPLAPVAPTAGFSKEAPHIGLIWDASLSRLHSNRRRELQLLSDALHHTRTATIDVTVLRNVAEPTRRFVVNNGDATAIASFLESTPCDGGTDLSALRFPRVISGQPVDAYVLFSDGLDTLAGDPPTMTGAPVYAVSTDPRADHTLLRRLSERSGGAYLNLTQMTDPEAVAAMGCTPYSLLTVAVTSGLVTDVFPDSPQPIQGRVTVTGRLRSEDAAIDLVYGYRNLISGNDQITSRKSVALHHADSTSAEGLIARFWARSKAAALEVKGDKAHAALIALGHDFNIVTPTTSLLVLDTLDQYVRYHVQPPMTQFPLLVAWMQQYRAQQNASAEMRHDKLAEVLNLWNQKVSWYNSPPRVAPERIMARTGRGGAGGGEPAALGLAAGGYGVMRAGQRPGRSAASADFEARAINGNVQIEDRSAAYAMIAHGRPPAAPPAPTAALQANQLGVRSYAANAPTGTGRATVRPAAVSPSASDAALQSAGTVTGYQTATANGVEAPTTFALQAQAMGNAAAYYNASYGTRTVHLSRDTSSPTFVVSGGGMALYNSNRSDAVPGAPVATVTTIKAWSPETPYLKALRAAGPANAYAAYLKQRSGGYEASPAFYLDCAEYLIRAGQPALGVRVLTSILDLKIEQPSLVRIVAHRMTQLGYRDAGIRLFDYILRLRPEEPQSYRDLALALSDRADDEMSHSSTVSATADDNRALGLLNDVVLNQWDDRFPEIETIALDEANRIVARANDHYLPLTDPIDPRLVRNLDCDLRILLTWNTDETDQDLWVTEPTGEKCFYGYNRTTIGGRLSHDFTQGYGPEEYLLRKAVHGKYVIQTNYYGQHSPELDGGTTVQATVITNWGRPTEKRQYLTVRVNKATDVVDIGSVVR